MKNISMLTLALAVLFVLQSHIVGELKDASFPKILKRSNHPLPCLHMKDRLRKRVNECMVTFRFEMNVKSVRVCKFFEFSFTHHFFPTQTRRNCLRSLCFLPTLGLLIFRPLGKLTCLKVKTSSSFRSPATG